MNSKVQCRIAAASVAATLLITSLGVRASSMADRSLAELYKTSSLLLYGSIESERSECIGDGCIYNVKFDVKESIKGNLVSSEVALCSLNSLGVKEQYFVFVVPGASVDTFGIRCDLVVLTDGAIKEDSIGKFFRHMSPNAYGRLVKFEGDVYRTAEIEDTEFSEMLLAWRSAIHRETSVRVHFRKAARVADEPAQNRVRTAQSPF